jgi:magnesium transporter
MKKVSPRKPKNILSRKNKIPEKFVFTGTEYLKDSDIQLFEYNAENHNEQTNIIPEKLPEFAKPQNNYWLNVYGISNTEDIEIICRKQGIHGLVIQDILDVNQRPKYQAYEDYHFFSIKSVIPGTDDQQTEQISFIFGKNYIISFQERKADYFEHIRYRIRESVGLVRKKTSDFLLYLMLEAILDNYFKAVQLLEERTAECFVSGDFDKDLSPNVLKTNQQIKRHLHILKKCIQPIKDFSSTAERSIPGFIESEHIKYFSELKDLCLTLIDSCETLELQTEQNSNMFFSVQGHRMNLVMKTLTVVATIFIPLTFVVGVYGMNFEKMPELSWEYGYLAVWIIMLVLVVLMLFYFRRKKWF